MLQAKPVSQRACSLPREGCINATQTHAIAVGNMHQGGDHGDPTSPNKCGTKPIPTHFEQPNMLGVCPVESRAFGHRQALAATVLWMAVMDQTFLDMRDSGNLDGFGVLEGLLDFLSIPAYIKDGRGGAMAEDTSQKKMLQQHNETHSLEPSAECMAMTTNQPRRSQLVTLPAHQAGQGETNRKEDKAIRTVTLLTIPNCLWQRISGRASP